MDICEFAQRATMKSRTPTTDTAPACSATNRPTLEKSNDGTLCLVRSMRGSAVRISEGSSVSAITRVTRTPRASVTPRSSPKPRRMTVSAKKPAHVVMAAAETDLNVAATAVIIASSGSERRRSSSNRWYRNSA